MSPAPRPKRRTDLPFRSARRPGSRLGLLSALLLALVGGTALWWWRDRPTPPAAPPSAATVAAEPAAPATLDTPPAETLRIVTEPADVFQRALWRRPAADDVILHAERREVAATADQTVKTWAWFLAVQPGAELRAWLATNPFALHDVPNPAPLPTGEGIPAWFPRDLTGFTHQQNAEGRLRFWYAPERNLLYATDAGAGFRPPARQP